MASGLLIFPGAQPSRSRSGSIITAELRWYLNQTTTPATVYTDEALTIPHPFPIVSDDAGRFPLIWADTADSFSCNWSTAAPDSQSSSFDDLTTTQGADVILLDEMNSVLSDAMDLYDSLAAVDEAVTAAKGFAADAAEAATGAPGTNSTSTSLLTIGEGSKSLTVEANKLFVPGMTITIASTASPTNAMTAQVQSYDTVTGAMVALVGKEYTGSGSFSAWTISLSALAQTIRLLRSTRTSDTILAASDWRTYVDVTSGTFTQTLTAAGTLGDGWYVDYGNSGTGVVTIDPAGTELIGGFSTLSVYPGEVYRIQCDGSNFNLIGLKLDPGPHVVVQDQKASGTDGGSAAPGGTRVKRTLNTVLINRRNASLASNNLTLQPGRWRLDGWAMVFGNTASRLYIENITDATIVGWGEGLSFDSSATGKNTVSVEVTITSAKAFALTHRKASALAATDFGVQMGFGDLEIYAELSATQTI